MTVDDLILDQNSHIVTRAGKAVSLTRKEFHMLEYFMRHAGIVLSRTQIMEHIWTADGNPFSNTIEAHMRNLRKKINTGGRKNLIANVPGRGYLIDTPENIAKL